MGPKGRGSLEAGKREGEFLKETNGGTAVKGIHGWYCLNAFHIPPNMCFIGKNGIDPLASPLSVSFPSDRRLP